MCFTPMVMLRHGGTVARLDISRVETDNLQLGVMSGVETDSLELAVLVYVHSKIEFEYEIAVRKVFVHRLSQNRVGHSMFTSLRCPKKNFEERNETGKRSLRAI